ncbi:MAG: TIGR00645 family protein [Rhodocyclaceae bacterium]
MPNPPKTNPAFLRALEGFIFWSRWLQAPLYVGLIIAQGVYVYQFMLELSHLVTRAGSLGETDIMLIVLGLIDVVMIANLLIMVIIGGYETFVSRLDLEGHPDQPEWLSHVNAGVLKVKLATALIGISSIHLLKSFINASQLPDRVILWQVAIHLAFLVSALSIAWTDKIMTTTLSLSRKAAH